MTASSAKSEPRPQRDIRVGAFEPWMFDQLVSVHARQYEVSPEFAERALAWRLRHPYSLEHSILIAAWEGDRPVGMQTWMSWPYERKGGVVRSYQSGGTLVDPDYRGHRIFQRMLKAGNEVARRQGVDCFTGFPVAESLGGFLNDGWAVVAQPRWFVAPNRLDAWAFGSPEPNAIPRPFVRLDRNSLRQLGGTGSGFGMSNDEDFLAWRYLDSPYAPYAFWRHDAGGASTVFIVRWRTRRAPECLLVDIRTTCATAWQLASAIWALRSAVFRAGGSVVASVMLHAGRQELLAKAMLAAGMLPTWKRATFIVKNLSDVPNAYDAKEWTILARDMDVG